MGYFSNASEGMDYQFDYCDNCKHWKQRPSEPCPGCPIWDMHMSWNYEACKDENADKAWVLGSFIPRTLNGCGNQQCVFFEREASTAEREADGSDA